MTSHEFMYMNKHVNTLSSFPKIGIATKRFESVMYYPHFFTHKYRGQIMGAVSTTDKTFGPFSEWDLRPKKTFRSAFSAL